MPIPFDIITVMLFLGYYAETPDPNPPEWGFSLAVVAGCALALALAAVLLNRISLSLIRRRRTTGERRQVAFAADLLLRVLLVAAYVFCLVKSALPWSVAAAFGWKLTGNSFIIQMLGLFPYIVFFPAAWIPVYGLHCETTSGAWSRWSFFVHKTRYNLYMLLAWIPFALLFDWLSGFLALLPLLFLAAAWAFPYLLAKAWGCRELDDARVSAVIHRLEERAGVRFSRAYLWEPGGGGTQNAAAVGVLPPFRYLFVTPALIRNMNDEELEAVILHELGHVKNNHLLFYLVTSLAGINLAAILGGMVPLAGSGERFFLTAILVLLYFRIAFGWLSRRMERQADLFALEKSGSARGLTNALEKLALGAGNIRMAHSWHHMGIAQRVDFLRHAERFPELMRRHNAGVGMLMRIGYSVSLILIGVMVYAAYQDFRPASRRNTVPSRTRENEEEAHWRRVMALMPESAGPRLELAYRLAGRAESRKEAAVLAAQALRLSSGGQTDAAARKLIRDLEQNEAGETRN